MLCTVTLYFVQHGAESEEHAAAVEAVEAELRADDFFDDGNSAACRVPRELHLKQGAQAFRSRSYSMSRILPPSRLRKEFLPPSPMYRGKRR